MIHLSTCLTFTNGPCTCGADRKRSEREARANSASEADTLASMYELKAELDPNPASRQGCLDEAARYRADAMKWRGAV